MSRATPVPQREILSLFLSLQGHLFAGNYPANSPVQRLNSPPLDYFGSFNWLYRPPRHFVLSALDHDRSPSLHSAHRLVPSVQTLLPLVFHCLSRYPALQAGTPLLRPSTPFCTGSSHSSGTPPSFQMAVFMLTIEFFSSVLSTPLLPKFPQFSPFRAKGYLQRGLFLTSPPF